MVIKENFYLSIQSFQNWWLIRGVNLGKRPNFSSKYLTIMYQLQLPYQICKALRAVRPEGFSSLICPEGLVHNYF